MITKYYKTKTHELNYNISREDEAKIQTDD